MTAVPVGAIGSEWSVGKIGSPSPGEGSTTETPASVGSSGGFGGALTNAISSLEQTQQGADSAAQALATGTLSDPESAVMAVENAQMAMELAAQIRTKATEAAQSVFQTQI